MPAAVGLGFLLPIGLWLMMTSAADRGEEGRAASAGFLAVAVSTVAFAGIGFALMFGGVGVTRGIEDYRALSAYAALPAAGVNWGIAGMSGFGLAGVGQAELSLFLAYLPLAHCAALIAAGACYRHASWLRQALIGAAIGGLALPLPGFWLWGGGWLAGIGLALGFGHGALDLGGLGLAGLAGGAVAGVWLMTGPRRPLSAAARLPAASLPMRAFAGAPLVLIGAVSLAAANPLFMPYVAQAGDAQAVNTFVAAATAALSAQAYAVFVSRRPDALLSARAALAATIALSAGAALVTPAIAGAAGLLLGVAWPIIHFVVTERLLWSDDEGIVATVLVPAAVGMLLPGLFATGAAGAGLNGVGALTYLGVTGLGVVGVVAPVGVPDTGQFTAQALAIPGAIACAGAFALAAILPFRRGAPAATVSAERAINAEARTAEEALPSEVPPASLRQAEPPRETEPERPAQAQPRSIPAVPRVLGPAEGVIARLRRMSAERQRPPVPQQARKVAYPSRVAGKRLFARPMAEPPVKPDENGSKP